MIYLIQIRFDRSLALSHINSISIRSQIKSLSQAEYQKTRKPEINYPKYSHISLELLQNDTFTTFFPRQYCLLKGTHIKLSMSTICLLYVSIYHMHPTNTETTTRTTTTNRSLKTENRKKENIESKYQNCIHTYILYRVVPRTTRTSSTKIYYK